MKRAPGILYTPAEENSFGVPRPIRQKIAASTKLVFWPDELRSSGLRDTRSEELKATPNRNVNDRFEELDASPDRNAPVDTLLNDRFQELNASANTNAQVDTLLHDSVQDHIIEPVIDHIHDPVEDHIIEPFFNHIHDYVDVDTVIDRPMDLGAQADAGADVELAARLADHRTSGHTTRPG